VVELGQLDNETLTTPSYQIVAELLGRPLASQHSHHGDTDHTDGQESEDELQVQ